MQQHQLNTPPLNALLITLMMTAVMFLFTDMALAHAQSAKNQCKTLDPKLIKALNSRTIVKNVLPNGLPVYLHDTDRGQSFALRVVISVGGRDEVPGESGYAHLFEHMMFKGTLRVPDGALFHAVRSTGGRINATTDYDKTDYWQEMPVNFLKRALFLESDRLQHLIINKKKLDNQIEAVLEEKKMRLDNIPYAGVVSRFMVKQWSDTPYGHLLIGTDDDLKSANVKKVSRFLKNYYVPNNANLTIVGNINIAQTMEWISEYFTSWPKGQINQRKRFKAIKQEKSNTKLYDPLAPFPLYGIAWHTVGYSNPDYLKVKLLSDILIDKSKSRIRYLLKEEKDMVFEVLGMPFSFQDLGLANMVFAPRSFTSFDMIKQLVKDELQSIREQGVTHDELCSVIKKRQIELLRQLSTNKGMAIAIGNGVTHFNNPAYYIDLLTRYESISAEAIQTVAQRYFTEDWLAVEVAPGWLIQIAKWILETIPRSWSEALERQFL